eukprot:PhF_6_TR40769/c1_g1_i4/m.61478/K10610/DDB1; DNA damage-binding protein 1
MSHFYNVTLHKSTAVQHAVLMPFTSPDVPDVILSHTNQLTVWSLNQLNEIKQSDHGVQPLLEIPLFGEISEMHTIRNALYITFSNDQFALLRYNSHAKKVETVFSGELKNYIGSLVSQPSTSVHVESSVVVHHQAIGFVRVVHLEPSFETYTLPVDRNIVNFCLLDGFSSSGALKLVAITEDSRSRRVQSFDVDVTQRSLRSSNNCCVDSVEQSTNLIIPVGARGALFCGDQYACFAPASGDPFTVSFEPMKGAPSSEITTRVCWTALSPTQFAIGSLTGRIHILTLSSDNSLSVRVFSHVGSPSCIVGLSSGVLLMGAKIGDSYILRENTSPTASDDSKAEAIEFLQNIGPVMSMIASDIDESGRNALISCSGGFANATLRVIRSGIAVRSSVLSNVPGVRGMWSLKRRMTDNQQSYVVLAFLGGTIVLSVGNEVQQENVIDGSVATVHCTNLEDSVNGKGYYAHVGPQAITLLTEEGWQKCAEFSAPSGQEILLGSNSKRNLAIGAGRSLCVVNVQNGSFQIVATHELPHDIACLNLSLEDTGMNVVTVGTWSDHVVTVFGLPSMNVILRTTLPTLPRSCLIHRFEDSVHLMVGQGNGMLAMWKIINNVENGSVTLHDERTYNFGSKAVSLVRFDDRCVVVRGLSNSVFYHNGKRLILTDLNVSNIEGITPFTLADSSARTTLMITQEGDLCIGEFESIQKLHIQTLPMSESPVMIAQHSQSNSFVMVTRRYPNVTYNDNKIRHDMTDMLRVLDRTSLNAHGGYPFDHQAFETVMCMHVGLLGDEAMEYVVIGTAYAKPGEPEPKSGRILVLSIDETLQLHVVEDKVVQGGVFSISTLGGRVVAGISNRIHVYKWVQTSSRRELQSDGVGGAGVLSLTIAVQEPDIIAVGDYVRSVSLLRHIAATSAVEEVAHDYNPMWITALTNIGEDMFVAFDNCRNLSVLRQNKEAAPGTGNESKLDVVARFRTGVRANTTFTGVLTTRNVSFEDVAEGEVVVRTTHPPVLYSGVSGSLNLLLPIPKDLFHFCKALEKAMVQCVEPIGNLVHAQYRSHGTEKRTVPAHGVIDGDVVELFVELSEQERENVVSVMNKEVPFGGKQFTVQGLMKKLDDLLRLHR